MRLQHFSWPLPLAALLCVRQPQPTVTFLSDYRVLQHCADAHAVRSRAVLADIFGDTHDNLLARFGRVALLHKALPVGTRELLLGGLGFARLVYLEHLQLGPLVVLLHGPLLRLYGGSGVRGGPLALLHKALLLGTGELLLGDLGFARLVCFHSGGAGASICASGLSRGNGHNQRCHGYVWGAPLP